MEFVSRFFRRILFSYKQESLLSDWKTYILFDLIPPISQTLFFSLVAYYSYGPDYLKKWMIGNTLLMASFNALFGVGTQIMVEKYHGTLSLLMASRTRLGSVFMSSTISAMLSSFISVVIGLTFISFLLNIHWNVNLMFSFVVVLLVAVFVSMSFGYIFACFILVTSETNLVLNLVSRILLIFTGANFSISKLPPVLQFFSNLLPLTRSIRVAQGLIEGQSLSLNGNLLLQEIFLGCCFLLLGVFLLKVMEYQARKGGSVEFV
ncbi:ABC transporter permease [Streptococcus caprae]|uniref:ABC transporter permease n=1 Tax=Streptococcus caprae TaxID=1640501 RepID=A0ABV8CT07_9STRE